MSSLKFHWVQGQWWRNCCRISRMYWNSWLSRFSLRRVMRVDYSASKPTTYRGSTKRPGIRARLSSTQTKRSMRCRFRSGDDDTTLVAFLWSSAWGSQWNSNGSLAVLLTWDVGVPRSNSVNSTVKFTVNLSLLQVNWLVVEDRGEHSGM